MIAINFQVEFGGHQYLFNVKINEDELPYIVMRYDVDGLLWKIPANPLQAQSSNVTTAHCKTFDAFGYVEAAKESRRLVSCSPSANYAVN